MHVTIRQQPVQQMRQPISSKPCTCGYFAGYILSQINFAQRPSLLAQERLSAIQEARSKIPGLFYECGVSINHIDPSLARAEAIITQGDPGHAVSDTVRRRNLEYIRRHLEDAGSYLTSELLNCAYEADYERMP